VVEDVLVVVGARFVEVVHVELADERGEIVVLEVAREYLLCEFVGLFDDEAVALRVPSNGPIAGGVLGSLVKKIRIYVYNVVGLEQEGGDVPVDRGRRLGVWLLLFFFILI